MRVGNVVTVSGRVNICLTTTLLASRMDMSLPIASSLSAIEQCGGTANSTDTQASWGIYADATNKRAIFYSTGIVSVANSSCFFSFTYTVL